MPGPLCFWGRAVLRRLELALGRDAISLAHRGEALTLAGVLAGTGGLATLAGALTRHQSAGIMRAPVFPLLPLLSH